MKTIAAALLVLFLSTSAAHAAPSAQSTCRLRQESAQVVVIVSGPCWKRDFPPTCQIPARIAQGMRIYCPAEKQPGQPAMVGK